MHFLKGQIARLRVSFRFYASYKGSLFNLIKRRLSGILNKPRYLKQNAKAEKELVLLEIAKLKIRLEKAIRSL